MAAKVVFCEVCYMHDSSDEHELCIHCNKSVCIPCMKQHTQQLSFEVHRLATNVNREAMECMTRLQFKNQDNPFGPNLDSLKITVRSEIDKLQPEIRKRIDKLANKVDQFVKDECEVIDEMAQREAQLKSLIDYCTGSYGKLNGNISESDLLVIKAHLAQGSKTLYNLTIPTQHKLSCSLEHRDLLRKITDLGTITVSHISLEGQESNHSDSPSRSITVRSEQETKVPIQRYKCITQPSTSDITCLAISSFNEDICVIDNSEQRVSLFQQNGAIKMKDMHIENFNVLWHPMGLTFSSNGSLYITDSANHCVHIFNKNGIFEKSFSRRGKESFQLNNPQDLVVTGNDDIYVCDYDNNRIMTFTGIGGGKTLGFLSRKTFRKPEKIHRCDSGNYVVEDANGLHFYNGSKQGNKDVTSLKLASVKPSIPRNTAFALSDESHIMYAVSDVVWIHEWSGGLFARVESQQAKVTRSPIQAIALRNDTLVVAGKTFIELYNVKY